MSFLNNKITDAEIIGLLSVRFKTSGRLMPNQAKIIQYDIDVMDDRWL